MALYWDREAAGGFLASSLALGVSGTILWSIFTHNTQHWWNLSSVKGWVVWSASVIYLLLSTLSNDRFLKLV